MDLYKLKMFFMPLLPPVQCGYEKIRNRSVAQGFLSYCPHKEDSIPTPLLHAVHSSPTSLFGTSAWLHIVFPPGECDIFLSVPIGVEHAQFEAETIVRSVPNLPLRDLDSEQGQMQGVYFHK
jgi:hypothetical protein